MTGSSLPSGGEGLGVRGGTQGNRGGVATRPVPKSGDHLVDRSPLSVFTLHTETPVTRIVTTILAGLALLAPAAADDKAAAEDLKALAGKWTAKSATSAGTDATERFKAVTLEIKDG